LVTALAAPKPTPKIARNTILNFAAIDSFMFLP
jgi:hypothetical protein